MEAVRAQIEGPYGQIVKVDIEKVRALREKDTEIRRLQQQMHQLEVGSVCVCVGGGVLVIYILGMDTHADINIL